jgi:hypothetical protein
MSVVAKGTAFGLPVDFDVNADIDLSSLKLDAKTSSGRVRHALHGTFNVDGTLFVDVGLALESELLPFRKASASVSWKQVERGNMKGVANLTLGEDHVNLYAGFVCHCHFIAI